MSKLHLKIKFFRLIHNKTQEEIAEQIFMTLKTYQRKEMGISAISDQDLSKIAQCYNLTIAQIHRFDPELPPFKWSEPELLLALQSENEQLKSELAYLRQILDEIVGKIPPANRDPQSET